MVRTSIAAGPGLEVATCTRTLSSGRVPVLRNCTARCNKSNQNGAPNSVVDAVTIQPATCRAKAVSSTGGKADQPIGSAHSWRSAVGVERGGRAP